MLVNWISLSIALFLLLPPIAWFHGRHVHYRAVARHWDGYWRKTFLLGLHAIDFARAALGAWLLAGALARAPEIKGVLGYLPLVLQCVLTALATTLQTLVCREPGAAHAPFAFVSGLVVGFLPPFLPAFTSLFIPAFALLLAVVSALGVRSPSAFFPLLALTLAASGTMLSQRQLLLPLLALVPGVMLPWLLTLLFPRHFVVSYRSRRPPARAEP